YRNTREIIGTALAVAGDSDVDDLGEAFRRGDAIAEASRQGAKPLLVRAADLDGQLDELVRQMNELTATDRIGPGDVAVLVPTNWMVERVMRHLEQPGAGFKTQSLAQYDGQPNDMVKVGTYHRGKGLEFKAVFLPGLSRDTFPRQPREGLSPEEAAEARELEISALFVAMTRARDVLVVLYDGEPSEVLAGRKDRFDHLEVV